MIKVNIHEAKTHLSRYLERLSEGERIVLCKRNVPIAEIRPLKNLARLAWQRTNLGFHRHASSLWLKRSLLGLKGSKTIC